MRTYRVALPLVVHTADGSYKQGEEFENEFTAEEETSNLESGLLELVPAEYKVIGTSKVYETQPGGTFTAALPIGNEEQLIAGGHIERVEHAEKKKTKATTKGKED